MGGMSNVKRGDRNGMRLKGFSNTCEDTKNTLSLEKTQYATKFCAFNRLVEKCFKTCV